MSFKAEVSVTLDCFLELLNSIVYWNKIYSPVYKIP